MLLLLLFLKFLFLPVDRSLSAFIVIVVGFDPASYFINETTGTVELTVRLTMGSLERSAIVSYFTIDGTATSEAPADFMSVSGPLTFSQGVATQQFSIGIVNDAILEDMESFLAGLRTSDNSVRLLPDRATVNIEEEPGDDRKWLL